MNIFVTFDYELYFGTRTGTVERCITGPTDLLTEMANRQGVKLCHFTDIGFLLRLEEEMKKHPSLAGDHALICRQLERLINEGHDLQLHIHPHWEDSYYDGTKWVCDVRRYKLADFTPSEISDIVHRYYSRLVSFTGSAHLKAYRAGGWCIQPFDHLRAPLLEKGIHIDSSVFANGYYQSGQYAYDFRGAPLSGRWQFENDPMLPVEDGKFTEIPISSIHNSPLFYWRLFLLGRLNPHQHKPLGDGIPVAAPGQRFNILTRWTYNTVSVDGYNASLLNRALRQHLRLRKSDMVIIGHPKALTRYGLNALERFIQRYKDQHRFTTFREEK
ncbi:MAG: hypothetical protein U0Y08_04820 [Bacteroidia bacterium]